MPTMVPQHSFRSGEIDIQNWKRSDVESYLTGAQSLLNMEIGVTGLSQKRKATKYQINVGTAIGGIGSLFFSKMYEFRDNYGNYYIILGAANAVPAAVTWYIFLVSSVNGAVSPVLYQSIPGTGYVITDLVGLDYANNNDTLVLTGGTSGTTPPTIGSVTPSRIYVSAYTGSPPTPTFAWQSLPFSPVPTKDFGLVDYGASSVVVTSSVSGSTLTFTLTGVPITTNNFSAAWIGGLIIGTGTTDLQPIGLALISNVAVSGSTTTFTAQILVPILTTAAGGSTSGSQYSIQQPAWSTALGWPTKCTFYQNRLWLANTPSLPSTVFGSELNAFLSFDVGTGSDINAIVYDLGNGEAGSIHWLNGGKQLEIYTHNLEFAAPQELNVALTPNTFSVRQQSSYGASQFLKPVTYINDSYFISRSRKAIINFHFDGIGQTYTSSNVALQSSHLISTPIKAAVLRGTDNSQDNFIYFLQDLTTLNTAPFAQLTTFQFENESKLAALTPFAFEQSITTTSTIPQVVFVQDICTVDNRVYFLKQYRSTTNVDPTFTIEMMVPDLNNNPNMVVKMDSATTVTLADAGIIGGIDVLLATGDLTYLNGYYVNLVVNNQNFGQSLGLVNGIMVPQPVTGGQAYFANSKPGTTATTGIVGIVFHNEIKPMYTFSGTANSPDYKDISSIFIDYYLSIDFQVDGNFVPFQTYAQIQSGVPPLASTDTALARPVDGWNRYKTFTISQYSPFDLNVTGILYQVEDAII